MRLVLLLTTLIIAQPVWVPPTYASCNIFKSERRQAASHSGRVLSDNERAVKAAIDISIQRAGSRLDIYTLRQLRAWIEIHPQRALDRILHLLGSYRGDPKFPVADLAQMKDALMMFSELARDQNRITENSGEVSVVFLDVKHFKLQNDTTGYDAADQALGAQLRTMMEEVNNRIFTIFTTSGRAEDMIGKVHTDEIDQYIPEQIRQKKGEIGRFGGDELVAVINGGEVAARSYYERVVKKINESDRIKELNRLILELAKNNPALQDMLRNSIRETVVTPEILQKYGIQTYYDVFNGQSEVTMDYVAKIESGITRIGSVGGGFYTLKPHEALRLADISDAVMRMESNAEMESEAQGILTHAITSASEMGAQKKAEEKADLGYGRAN